jgi:NNP family nitrate/nitrite transporter-like MFS transporter
MQDSQTTQDASFSQQLWPLLFLVGIFLLTFLSRIILAPLLPAIEKSLGISHAQSGALFLFVSLGYFVSLFSSGLVSSRLGHRRTIIISALAVGLVMLGLTQAASLAVLNLGAFLIGLAGGLYLPSGIATLTDLVAPRHWGKALAVHELAPNLGLFSGPLVAEGLLRVGSWQGVLGWLGLACLVLGLVFWRWGKGGDFKGQAPNPANLKRLVMDIRSWVLMILFSLGIGGSLGVYTMLPLYLVTERGLDLAMANYLVGFSRLAGVVASFVAGWASDRMGPRQALAWVFALTGLSTIALGLLPPPWLWVALFAQPIMAVCFFPAGFAALSSMGDPSLRSLTVSVVVPMGFVLGGGALPAGIGWLGEVASFQWGIALSGVLFFCGVFLMPLLKAREPEPEITD